MAAMTSGEYGLLTLNVLSDVRHQKRNIQEQILVPVLHDYRSCESASLTLNCASSFR